MENGIYNNFVLLSIGGENVCLPVCNPEFTGNWNGSGSGLCTGITPTIPTNLCNYDGIAIYLGNENAVTDDDIEIRMNGVTVGTYVDEIGNCTGLCGTSVEPCASPSTTSMMSFKQILISGSGSNL